MKENILVERAHSSLISTVQSLCVTSRLERRGDFVFVGGNTQSLDRTRDTDAEVINKYGTSMCETGIEMHTRDTEARIQEMEQVPHRRHTYWTQTNKSVRRGTHRKGIEVRDETHTWDTYTGQGHVMGHTEQK